VFAGHAFVADGLRIIDVANPSAPYEKGYLDTDDVAQGVAVEGGFAYVADYGDGLRVVDVSNPDAPVEVGRYDTGSLAMDVVLEGNHIEAEYAYVADY
jgi:hypothetical protein